MLTKNSSRPDGGGVVPSTSPGIRLCFRYRTPLVGIGSGSLKHYMGLGVDPVNILVRSSAQATTAIP
jgi:hypothetical protein